VLADWEAEEPGNPRPPLLRAGLELRAGSCEAAFEAAVRAAGRAEKDEKARKEAEDMKKKARDALRRLLENVP
jgi:hypothetical protein